MTSCDTKLMIKFMDKIHPTLLLLDCVTKKRSWCRKDTFISIASSRGDRIDFNIARSFEKHINCRFVQSINECAD